MYFSKQPPIGKEQYKSKIEPPIQEENIRMNMQKEQSTNFNVDMLREQEISPKMDMCKEHMMRPNMSKCKEHMMNPNMDMMGKNNMMMHSNMDMMSKENMMMHPNMDMCKAHKLHANMGMSKDPNLMNPNMNQEQIMMNPNMNMYKENKMNREQMTDQGMQMYKDQGMNQNSKFSDQMTILDQKADTRTYQESLTRPPQTVSDVYFTPGFLKTQIGNKVRVEFLIGSNAPMVDRVGTLQYVGASYILIQLENTDDLEMCDLYSIKFVTIYR